jgi:hypothetical protein
VAQQYRRQHRDRDSDQQQHHNEPEIGFDLGANHRRQREVRADPVKAAVEVNSREKKVIASSRMIVKATASVDIWPRACCINRIFTAIIGPIQ